MASVIKSILSLGFPWETADPFLFCVHHEDFYPKGNAQYGPEDNLSGRNLGSDFVVKDGYRMYHGTTVPGFPAHPHRGFETVTIVRKGLADHSDSMGASGRFGNGDVQWMTAGKGVMHSEMFPLIDQKEENPLELFQIWLNLPKKDKMVEPHYKMLWSEEIPEVQFKDGQGKVTKISLVAGNLNGVSAPLPTPNSWAANPENEVAIWNVTMESGAEFIIKASKGEVNRTLYLFKGANISIEGKSIANYKGVRLHSTQEVVIKNGDEPAQILFLQGKPINEPVAKYGPFVMNTQAEIQQAMMDYQRTHFGGWPWPKLDPVHGGEKKRFAKHADGRIEERG